MSQHLMMHSESPIHPMSSLGEFRFGLEAKGEFLHHVQLMGELEEQWRCMKEDCYTPFVALGVWDPTRSLKKATSSPPNIEGPMNELGSCFTPIMKRWGESEWQLEESLHLGRSTSSTIFSLTMNLLRFLQVQLCLHLLALSLRMEEDSYNKVKCLHIAMTHEEAHVEVVSHHQVFQFLAPKDPWKNWCNTLLSLLEDKQFWGKTLYHPLWDILFDPRIQ